MKNVAFTASVEQLATLVLYRRGESDLVHRDGMWFLNATCEVPEAEPNTEPVDFLGIDLGGKRRRKEARRAKDLNHKIAKHVVAEAERTGRGIALEDLTGIRERVRLRKPQRATSIRRTPPVPAPSAATSTGRTGSPRPGSRAGPADSLITRTGTAPATSAPARGSCGDAGPSQRPQPHLRSRPEGQDANAAPQPVAPVVQARRFSDE
jgi:hypothetical protein